MPFGKYVAGNHHLRIVHNTFAKDQHGLRERDISHKDKQNYEAVIQMTSDSVMEILMSMSDAKGTVAYLKLMKSITDTFLDKSLDCLVRIKKAWHSVCILQYWRQWVILYPEYNLTDHFITCNTRVWNSMLTHLLCSFYHYKLSVN